MMLLNIKRLRTFTYHDAAIAAAYKLDLDPEQFPWLTSLGRNLTSLALHQKLDPAIGRKAELEQLIDV